MERLWEREIIGRVLAGEREQFAHLVDAYKGQLFHIAYMMTGSAEEADDLVQETFAKVYENLYRFDRDRRFFSWLYTICLNTTRRHLKRRSRQEQVGRNAPVAFPGGQDHAENQAGTEAGTIAATGDSAEEHYHMQQRLVRLGVCLAQLPVDMREALTLRFLNELSFKELGDILEVTTEAAKMRVYRGLARLRELMGDENE
ncbi:MAG: RNA polymerase sigma factor [Oceanidesulfovibrio sp.]